MQRGFSVVKKYEHDNLNLPVRATQRAAGYDFQAAENFVLPSIWRLPFLKILWQIRHNETITTVDDEKANHYLYQPVLRHIWVKMSIC
jgi:dUTP pyrophosphatase